MAIFIHIIRRPPQRPQFDGFKTLVAGSKGLTGAATLANRFFLARTTAWAGGGTGRIGGFAGRLSGRLDTTSVLFGDGRDDDGEPGDGHGQTLWRRV